MMREWASGAPAPARGSDPLIVAVVPGEGIGPEVVGAALEVLTSVGEAFGLHLDLVRTDHIGSLGPHGLSVDDITRSFMAEAFAAGAPVLHGPAGGRYVYELRAQLGLHCKFVPVRPMPELSDASILRPQRVAGVDVLVVRDNSGGLYQGSFGTRDDGRVAFQEAAYSVEQVDRLLAVAARAARGRRGRLAVVTKPGGIPTISELWQRRAADLGGTDLEVEVIEADNACYQLVADPRRFDVVATPNMLGDVVADTAALVLGSRGMALSANFGDDGRAVYQTGHGAAHDLAGSDRANPVAQIQSLALLLRESLGLDAAAQAVEQAVAAVLAEGMRTPDIAGPESVVVGTRALGAAIAERVAAAVPSAAG